MAAARARQPGEKDRELCENIIRAEVTVTNLEKSLGECEKEHDEMWKKISTKISRSMFVFIVGGLFLIGMAVFAFQWNSFAQHQTEQKAERQKLDDKLDKMSDEILTNQILIREGNGN